jgi:hypothetical protein
MTQVRHLRWTKLLGYCFRLLRRTPLTVAEIGKNAYQDCWAGKVLGKERLVAKPWGDFELLLWATKYCYEKNHGVKSADFEP